MYRVMIVDDEEPVLDSFAFVIKKHVTNFSLCAKARSGTEAIRLAAEHKPDLIFMDIHMPGIDGIDTISEIRRQYPNTVFILATAYERFDIAQRAIPLGIFSYLVKPISKNTLVEEFRKVESHLNDIRERSEYHLEDVRILNRTRDEIKDRFLSGLVWGNPGKDEWDEFCHLHSLSCSGGCIALIDTTHGLQERKRQQIIEALNEKISFKYKCYQLNLSGRIMQFFPDSQNLEKLESRYANFVNGFSDVVIRVGTGSVHEYSSLHSSYREALMKVEDAHDFHMSFVSECMEIRELCSLFLRGDFEPAMVSINGFWNEAFRSSGFDSARGSMIAFFTMLFTSIDSTILESADLDIHPSKDIMGIKDVKEWNIWFQKALEEIQRLLSFHREDIYPPQLSKAISRIHKNYSEPIKLSSVAAECGISKSYLSRLFSEHLNLSFVDYLNKYRIEKAEILLRDKQVPVKEASRLVGYQDPNYFSRIFRRYTGISPSDLGKRRIVNGS